MFQILGKKFRQTYKKLAWITLTTNSRSHNRSSRHLEKKFSTAGWCEGAEIPHIPKFQKTIHFHWATATPYTDINFFGDIQHHIHTSFQYFGRLQPDT